MVYDLKSTLLALQEGRGGADSPTAGRRSKRKRRPRNGDTIAEASQEEANHYESFAQMEGDDDTTSPGCIYREHLHPGGDPMKDKVVVDYDLSVFKATAEWL